MDEDGHTLAGTVLQEGHDAFVVEVAVADVVADLNSHMTVADTAIKLGARLIGVLERYLAEREQPGVRCRDLQPEVVEDPGDRRRFDGVSMVGEAHGCRRHYLETDIVDVHISETKLRVPRVGGDSPKLLGAQHNGGFLLVVYIKP